MSVKSSSKYNPLITIVTASFHIYYVSPSPSYGPTGVILDSLRVSRLDLDKKTIEKRLNFVKNLKNNLQDFLAEGMHSAPFELNRMGLGGPIEHRSRFIHFTPSVDYAYRIYNYQKTIAGEMNTIWDCRYESGIPKKQKVFEFGYDYSIGTFLKGDFVPIL